MHIQRKAMLAMACIVLAMAATPVEAKEKWINLSTKNFSIVSNADEGATRKLALKLEQFQTVFSTLLNRGASYYAPVTVMVFKSDDSFKPFKPLYNGKPANISGYFQGGEDENIIAININTSNREERPMAIIYHEYTHLLTSGAPRDLPLWLKEGLAELYSSFDVEGNKVTLGTPIASHVFLLRDKKFIPLESLFSVNHDSIEYNERSKQGIFYAQSWALTHYLMLGDKLARSEQLSQFIKLLFSGTDWEQAFKEAFKTDYASMEKELRRYIKNDFYTVINYMLKTVEGDKEMSLRPISEAEAQAYLGNLLMRTQRMEEAETYFKKALEMDATLARAHEGLGFIAMRRDKHDEAMAHLKKAVSHESRNYLAHYYYAETLQRKAGGNISDDAAKEIISALKESIKLNPKFPHSYGLLAFAYLASDQNLGEAVEMVKTAIKLAPQNKHLALTLAQIQVQMRDYEGAKKTLEPLLVEGTEAKIKMSANSIRTVIEEAIRYARRREEPAPPPAPVAEATKREEPPPLVKEPPRFVGRPSVKIAGAQPLRCVLVKIECVRGRWFLVAQTSEKMLRFGVSNKDKLEFFSQVAEMEGTINCGSVNKVAFIYFKPAPAGSKLDGDAVAVEFTR